MELDAKDTKMIQGLSVLAMVCLHLFDRLEVNDLYTPLVYLWGVPLSYCLGQLSDFCVMGFAFCTGYGHMVLAGEQNFYKKRLKSLASLLINYWTILVVFSIISIIMRQSSTMPGNFKKFIYNFLLLDNSYNGAWWYMFTYVILVIISPVLLKITKKNHSVIIMMCGFLIYTIAYYLRFEVNTDNWLLLKAGPFGMTLFEYLLGMVACKCKWFTYICMYVYKLKKRERVLGAIVLLVGTMLVHTYVIRNVFIAPFTGLIIIFVFGIWNKPESVKRFFLFIGKYSTNIWLIHMFFYLTLFKDFVFVAKYPIVIYILMLLMSIFASAIIQMLCSPIQKRLFR